MSSDIIPYNEDIKIADKKDANVYLAAEYINNNDDIPVMWFPSADTYLPFYQTRDSLSDMDKYKSFIDNCIKRFRKSRTYKSYKAYLMSIGMDRCQVNGNIQDGMANIEMHHNFLTIYDITILISQHLLNTVGRCTTFDVIALLGQEHRNNNIPIVMLSETAHQLYHDNPDFYIPISMTFGKWWDLLVKYRYGITMDIAYKVVNYIRKCQQNNELTDLAFYKLANDVQNAGYYNEYSCYNNYCGNLVGYGSGTNHNYQYVPYALPGQVPQITDGKTGNGKVYTEAQLFGEGI